MINATYMMMMGHLRPSQYVRCCHIIYIICHSAADQEFTTDQRDTWSNCTCDQIRWYCTWRQIKWKRTWLRYQGNSWRKFVLWRGHCAVLLIQSCCKLDKLDKVHLIKSVGQIRTYPWRAMLQFSHLRDSYPKLSWCTWSYHTWWNQVKTKSDFG